MTTYTDDLTTLPAPSNIELEALDRARDHNGRMTFAEYCDAVAIHGPSRDRFREEVQRAINRMEAAGIQIPEPLRLRRWAWYQRWNMVLAQDDRETEMGARYAGVPR